jgi:hypothetical protein
VRAAIQRMAHACRAPGCVLHAMAPAGAGEGRMLDDDGRKMLRDGYRISAIGLEIALCVVLGLGGGFWLDRRLGSAPLWTLLLGAAGIAAAIKVIVRLIKRTDLDSR